MQYVTVEREIRRRPELVWEALVDVIGFPGWVEGLVDVQLQSDGPLREGAVIDLVWRSERKRLAGTAEITAFRPATLLAAETRVAGGLFFDRARLEPEAGFTRLEIVSEVMSGFGVADLFARPRGLLGAPNEDSPLQKSYERSVDAFVKRVEAMTAIPYR